MIQELVKSALITMNSASKSRQCGLDYLTYLKEYRTIELSLPRQVGKTSCLINLANSTSSRLFVPNQLIADRYKYSGANISTFGGLEYLNQNIRGRKAVEGLKYHAFFVDEPQLISNRQKELFDLYLLHCRIVGLISNDFYILKLGTN